MSVKAYTQTSCSEVWCTSNVATVPPTYMYINCLVQCTLFLCSHNHGHCIAQLYWHLSLTHYNPGPGCVNAG